MCGKSGQIPQFLKQKSTAKVWPGNIAKNRLDRNKSNREKVTKMKYQLKILPAIGRLLEAFLIANKFEPVHQS